ncbi:MAG: hypothetical protein R3E98_02040 [Gemmatimonadota bacterium]|nr:hypothetical protein [Gemmatimonadota bacterium]
MARNRWLSLLALLVLPSCAYRPSSPFDAGAPGPEDGRLAVMVKNWDFADVGLEIGSPAPDAPDVVEGLSTALLSTQRPSGGSLRLRILFANADGPRTLTEFVAVSPGERLELTIHDSSDRFEPGFRPYSIRTW